MHINWETHHIWIDGPTFTWMQCGCVAFGVILAIVTLILDRKGRISKHTKRKRLIIAGLLVLIGEFFLWFW